ncbi:GIY-YIG nuclease family protein [Schaalia sp. 19OD2882]|uniref:GIY-YIG nuclease family protein n=1 Tax=Schaalia sp. 19OD2882 TaxID=2794089 RepID=UPI001C1EBDE2|nr:GIY-YIG nuclease family protein [Schaalia sp. 19OD2882]QWW18930.1 GIY-YIG nuclease family protein [Schaalia sp. 19OD2882]
MMRKWKDLDPEVKAQVANELGKYVYMLVDPRDGVPFYVGKGRGLRFDAHGWEALFAARFDEGEVAAEDLRRLKVGRINEIRSAGLEPDIWIVRYGMSSDSEYTAVEAACIDLLRSMPIRPTENGGTRLPHGNKAGLTNARTEQAKGHGIVLLDDLIDELAAPLLTYDKPLLLIRLGSWVESSEEIPGGVERPGYGYKSEWLSSSVRTQRFEEIGVSACGWWPISPSGVEAEEIKYFVAVHRGVTRGLFRIVPGSWETKEYDRHESGRVNRRSACRFEVIDSGPDFDAIIGPHGHRIQGIQQNSFYWPFKR